MLHLQNSFFVNVCMFLMNFELPGKWMRIGFYLTSGGRIQLWVCILML